MRVGAIVAFSVLLVGAISVSAQTGGSVVDPAWIVPVADAAKKNPLAERPGAAAGGRKIFERTCVMCHGDASHERKNNAPNLSQPAVQAESDGALFWRITKGNSRRAMPSFSSLPELQRWQLVLYIRSLGENAAKNN